MNKKYEQTSAEVDKALGKGSVVWCGVLEKMNIEKYKKELESGIYEGVQDGTFYIGGKVVEKVLKDAVNEALAISRVVGRSEQLVCECCRDNSVEEQGDWCQECLDNPSRVITK